MPYITAAKLPELLRPYERVRFAGRDRARVDIHATHDPVYGAEWLHYPDCDIRALTGAGVERQWDGKAEVIEWDCITRVVIGRPNELGGIEYRVIRREVMQQKRQVAA